jgi:diaminohydroxyphosphoribosylaminopyrimidine deaminase / 5-amino-6-(5-phosphoribosylamino)uracil reductase
MRVALALAEQGRYSTSPNPCVGCVLIKDGAIVGRGYHRRAGQPHAEIVALSDAGDASRGATAYVTLEPCHHQGRTGPCTQALVDAGIVRVVYALEDPNKLVAGRGGEFLTGAGLEVTKGICSAEASVLNAGFFKRMKTGRPLVRIKLAMSLDACAALESGESQWITGPQARADVQRLRAQACVVLTGVGTVLADNPSLTVRDARFDMAGRQPRRVILDSTLRTPIGAKILALPGETLIFTGSADATQTAALEQAGAQVERIAEGRRPQLKGVFRRLAELEVNEILVEAGPTLVGQCIDARCFDELIIHLAPKLLGKRARRALDVDSPLQLADAAGLVLHTSEQLGDDIALTFRPRDRETED